MSVEGKIIQTVNKYFKQNEILIHTYLMGHPGMSCQQVLIIIIKHSQKSYIQGKVCLNICIT